MYWGSDWQEGVHFSIVEFKVDKVYDPALISKYPAHDFHGAIVLLEEGEIEDTIYFIGVGYLDDEGDFIIKVEFQARLYSRSLKDLMKQLAEKKLKEFIKKE